MTFFNEEKDKKLEKEMRNVKVPWPDDKDELLNFIDNTLERGMTGYGSAATASGLIAIAAFRFASSKMGLTGFQASHGAIEFIKRFYNLDYGFKVLDYEKLLFPQNWNREKFPDAYNILKENREALAEAAQEELDKKSEHMSEGVEKHLKELANKENPTHVNY